DGTPPLDDHNVRLLSGEAGTLTLARGEYVDALRQLYPVASTYWGDVAYIAERVLTVDELEHFVDANPPQLAAVPPPASTEDVGWPSPDPAVGLRNLLARRLVRAARYEEALRYFPPSGQARPQEPDVRGLVAAYEKALETASTGWRRVTRARAWYEAAVLAREHGMEMMGYEAAPDFLGLGGQFGEGLGQTDLAQ